MPPPLPASIKPSCGRVYNAYFPFTNSGCSTTLRCWLFDFRSGNLSQSIKFLVRTIPALATAEDRSPGAAVRSCRSLQKIPYIHPSSCAVRRISYTLVSSGSISGRLTGRSQNRKLSTPFGLSAMAKNDLRSNPSTRTISRYLPFHLMAPEFIQAFTPMRSRQYGLVSGFRS